MQEDIAVTELIERDLWIPGCSLQTSEETTTNLYLLWDTM